MIRSRQIVTVVWFALLAAGTAVALAADAPLFDAVRAADVERVRALIDQGADVRAAEPDGTTPLHWAAHGRQVEITRLLLGAGAVANVANRYGVRPLSSVAPTGQTRNDTDCLWKFQGHLWEDWAQPVGERVTHGRREGCDTNGQE